MTVEPARGPQGDAMLNQAKTGISDGTRMATVYVLRPSPSYSFTMRLHLPQRGGEFARVAGVIAEEQAMLGAIDLVRVEGDEAVRDVTVLCIDLAHSETVVAAIRDLDGVRVDSVS